MRYIAVGCLIDGSGAPLQRRVILAVDPRGRLAAIGRPGRDLPLRDRPVRDLGFATIVPPLADCSLLLSRSPAVDGQARLSDEGREGEQRAMAARHLEYCRAHGVLAVAAGDDPHDIAACRRHHEAGQEPPLVTVRAAGPLVRCWRDWEGLDLERADVLRLAYGPSLGPRPAPADADKRPRHQDRGLNREQLVSILAHRGHRKAVVVANGRQPVADALRAGCDAVEQGYDMGEDNLRRMADNGVLWLPSLVRAKNGFDSARGGGTVCCRFSQCYAAPGEGDPAAAAYWQERLASQSVQVGRAAALGVRMAVGTGAGAPGILHGEAVVEEMRLLRKAGLPVEEVVRCASANGAAFLGAGHPGHLRVGAQATFLVVRGGPQQVPRKLGYLEAIYVNGLPSKAYNKDPAPLEREG